MALIAKGKLQPTKSTSIDLPKQLKVVGETSNGHTDLVSRYQKEHESATCAREAPK